MRKFIQQWSRFFLSIVLPTIVAILLTIVAVYSIIIPAFEKSFVDGKKEMMRHLTATVLSVVEYYHAENKNGHLSREEAQRRALAVVEEIRYGVDNRDYFWINDTTPRLIMHPYSKELVGRDLSNFEDAQGKKIFLEIKKTVEKQDSGFIDYSWNKKYSRKMTVPKLSFVQRFAPWDWVIGTGVFLDDVERKTAAISKRLSRLGFAAVAILALLLMYVGRQSYLSEKQRNIVQRELAVSRAKYKRLVEMATEPILMVFEGKCIYSNTSVQSLTGLSPKELDGKAVAEIFSAADGEAGLRFMEHGKVLEGRYEAALKSVHGDTLKVALSITRMDLDGHEAAVINIRDDSGMRQIEQELDESRQKYRRLTSSLDIAVFRAEANSELTLLETNQAFRDLLRLGEEETVTGLRQILRRYKDTSNLYEEVRQNGYLKNRILTLRINDQLVNMSISLALTPNIQGEYGYCDGIIEDVSEEIRKERDREQLIVQLQTSLLFLNQPVADVRGEYVCCDGAEPVFQAAAMMRHKGCSSLLVRNQDGNIVGIVTDKALREKVVADKMDFYTPIAEVMSVPLIYIEETALIFEAVMLMEEKNIKHLVVKSEHGEATKVVSNEDLLDVHRYSSTYLVNEIEEAENLEEIIKSHERLPRIIKALVDSGAHARNITRITSRVS
ncbi:MAG: cache domain-containing protein, partial [Desulfopila sp.]